MKERTFITSLILLLLLAFTVLGQNNIQLAPDGSYVGNGSEKSGW